MRGRAAEPPAHHEPPGRAARLLPRALAAAGLALAAAAAALTVFRARLGLDLHDESFAVVLPWRWALGDRPFVDEQNLSQLAGLLLYPFVKLYAVLGGQDPAGLILFTRLLYLALAAAVAAAVFLLLRRFLRWPLALAAASVYLTFVFWGVTNLTYNSLGAGFFTLGIVFGARVVVGADAREAAAAPSRAVASAGSRYAAAAGACHALAVIAYPTLLFVIPFVAVLLAFAHGRLATAMLAGGRWRTAEDPEPGGPPTGPPARRALVAYVAGGAAPTALAAAALAATFLAAGSLPHLRGSLLRAWQFTMALARDTDQLAGTGKAFGVAWGFLEFVGRQPWLPLGMVAVYLVYRVKPRIGRALLLLLPPALFAAGSPAVAEGAGAAGLVVVYGLVAPYLYLFVPQHRRWLGARLLIWGWAPALVAGAMTAYTSVDGYGHAAVGLYPALVVSAVFLAWAIEAAAGGGDESGTEPAAPPAPTAPPAAAHAAPPAATGGTALAFLALAAVVAVTVAFQFQYQLGGVPFGCLTRTADWGPWWGVRMTAADERALRVTAADFEDVAAPAGSLPGDGRPGASLLVYPGAPGLYLLWPGEVVGGTVWVHGDTQDVAAPLPRSTVRHLRRRQAAPDVVLHLMDLGGWSDAVVRLASGGLGYPVAAVRRLDAPAFVPRVPVAGGAAATTSQAASTGYALFRRPPGVSPADVLARLRRE